MHLTILSQPRKRFRRPEGIADVSPRCKILQPYIRLVDNREEKGRACESIDYQWADFPLSRLNQSHATRMLESSISGVAVTLGLPMA